MNVLYRTAALVYTLLIVEVLVLVTTVPGLAVLVLLDRRPSNLPLMAACALPLGPALSAAVFALRHRSADLADLHPGRMFWRGYRLNALGVLRLWAPWLAWMSVLGLNLAYTPTWFVPLLVVAAAGALWMANALTIHALFTFRARDVARLAFHYLLRTPRVSLGTLALLIVALGVTWLSSEAVLGLLASVLIAALVVTVRPMLAEIEETFTA